MTVKQVNGSLTTDYVVHIVIFSLRYLHSRAINGTNRFSILASWRIYYNFACCHVHAHCN